MENHITIIEKDITTIESGIICHQTNCQGRMGSGVALSIAKKWPQALKEYSKFCKMFPFGKALGACQVIQLKDNPALRICNIFGQNNYGSPSKNETTYTDYRAVDNAFNSFTKYKQYQLFDVYVPWMMGCFGGGGNWDIYKAIIEKYIPNVIYCKWKG